MPDASNTAARRTVQPQDEFRSYEQWFVATPDPWIEITKLEHGGDRTFASTVRTMILNAEPAQRPAMEDRLLKALGQPQLTDAGLKFVCKMLALIGTAKSVPALVPFLRQARTSDAARYALDVIEDAAVDAAYREALGILAGVAKAGLIGSIALRGDADAAGVLARIASDSAESDDVRLAATRALERLRPKS